MDVPPTDPAPSEAPAPLVLERPLGPALVAWLLLLAAAVPGCIGFCFGVGEPALRARLQPLTGLLGPYVFDGTLAFLFFGPFALLLISLVVAALRRGRCELWSDLALFSTLGIERPLAIVPADGITGWETFRHGVRLTVDADVQHNSTFGPQHRVVIPTGDEAELVRATEWLGSLRCGTDQAPSVPRFGARFTRGQWYGTVAGTLAALVVSVGVMLLLLDSRLGAAEPSWVLGSLFAILAGSILAGVAWQPLITPVYVGQQVMTLGSKVFPLHRLTALAVGDGFVAAVGGGRTAFARVRPDQVDALRAVLAERLAGRPGAPSVSERLPPPARRLARRLRFALGLPLVLVTLGYPLAAAVAPNDRLLHVVDAHGQGAWLLTPRDSGAAPRFVAVSLTDGGSALALRTAPLWGQELGVTGGVSVDLRAGRGRTAEGEEFAVPPGTTFLLLGPGGPVTAAVDWSRRDALSDPVALGLRLAQALVELGAALAGASPGAIAQPLDSLDVPGLIGGLAPTGRPPALAEAVAGQTSRRVYDVVGADGERLVWGVDRGAVRFVVVAPAALTFTVTQGPMQWTVGTSPAVALGGDGPRVTRLDAGGGITDAPGPPPGAAALRTATAAIEAGASVREATAGLLPASIGE